MSQLDRPFTTLLHPDQALTVEQAAGWVRDLIDHYSQSVSALYLDTLPEDALRGYAETLDSLLECAGVLEQHLCGMCFFLPDQVSRVAVAIIVAAYYQSALLDSCIKDPGVGALIVVDEETLESMGVYLDRVAAQIVPLYECLASERYAMLQGLVKRVVTEMRDRNAPANSRVGSDDIAPCPPNPPRATRKNKGTAVPFTRLDAFLRRLSPDHFVDEFSTFRTGVPPRNLSPFPKDGSASSIAGLSSATAASSSSSPESLLDRGCDEPERRNSLASSDTTCVDEPVLDPPFHPEAELCSSLDEAVGAPNRFSPTPDPLQVYPSRKRHRKTSSTLAPSPGLPRPRKRRCQISLRSFGPDGGVSVCEDVEAHARPRYGRAVPVRRERESCPVPLPLPPRNISISPNASQGSGCTPASLRERSLSPLELELKPVGVPSSYVEPRCLRVPSAERIAMLLEASRARWWEDVEETTDDMSVVGVDVGEIDMGSDGEESDRESFTTANDEVYRAVEVSFESEREVEVSAPSSPAHLRREEDVGADEDGDEDNFAVLSPFPAPAPVVSSKAKGKRRCFASLLQTFKHIFNGR